MALTTDSQGMYRRRVGGIILGSIILLFAVLAGRLIQINTTFRARLSRIAERQQRGSMVLPARRGTIFDARGRVVACSRPSPDVFVDPGLVQDVDALSSALSARINLPIPVITQKIRSRSDKRYALLASRVDEVTAEAVLEMKNPAVGLADASVRSYPLGESMSQVLGLVGRDGQGLEGLEKQYDFHLRGRDGKRRTVRDARKRALWNAVAGLSPPADGGHIVLTIDGEIQRISEELIEEAVQEFYAESGLAIVLSPRTGDVLAMALSTFPNSDETPEEALSRRRNRAVTDPVEPGSVFKPIIACGALAGGFVSPTERIDCHMGQFRIGRRVITDTKPAGELDLQGIITKSSNIGMSIIAMRMGNDVLHETVQAFHFGQKTGVDFPGESAGLVRPLASWRSDSTASVSFGYEVLVTPLQLVAAFSAIINDGVLLKPRFVKQLLAADGSIEEDLSAPIVMGRAISEEIANFMAGDLLRSVVENGGGHRAETGSYRVIGKTGTAKLTFRDKPGYESGAYQSTFIGAAPARDPEVVVLVMVRRPDPSIGYYGGKVAAPAAGRILEKTLAYMQVPADEKIVTVSYSR